MPLDEIIGFVALIFLLNEVEVSANVSDHLTSEDGTTTSSPAWAAVTCDSSSPLRYVYTVSRIVIIGQRIIPSRDPAGSINNFSKHWRASPQNS